MYCRDFQSCSLPLNESVAVAGSLSTSVQFLLVHRFIHPPLVIVLYRHRLYQSPINNNNNPTVQLRYSIILLRPGPSPLNPPTITNCSRTPKKQLQFPYRLRVSSHPSIHTIPSLGAHCIALVWLFRLYFSGQLAIGSTVAGSNTKGAIRARATGNREKKKSARTQSEKHASNRIITNGCDSGALNETNEQMS